ncbi:MAG: hypothetical protein L6V85_03610 [Clostridiales bacterium]|nr:MAG: hypothetical protein L6V85_03610 [Clostridiales bacterium]
MRAGSFNDFRAEKNHPTVAYKLAQNIEIAEDNEIFQIRFFENGFHTAKFVLAVEELHKKYVEKRKNR